MSSAVRDERDAADFEIVTESSDALRARLTVHGVLTAETVSLLVCAVTTHLKAGRRYLRVDISAAGASDEQAIATLTELHDFASALGGTVVLDGPCADATLRDHAAALRARP